MGAPTSSLDNLFQCLTTPEVMTLYRSLSISQSARSMVLHLTDFCPASPDVPTHYLKVRGMFSPGQFGLLEEEPSMAPLLLTWPIPCWWGVGWECPSPERWEPHHGSRFGSCDSQTLCSPLFHKVKMRLSTVMPTQWC